ncbi:MAG: hypothetical protein IPP72_18960 [Chitinophagaceae bacterium]|nr:hypothetical protein [Chitinophagaceae bacterium]
MANDYLLYQKFTDTESAEAFVAVLNKNGIECHLQDNNHAYVKVYGYSSIDIAVGVNITDRELKEIISNPYEWGHLDYQLAKHLLNERGWEISEAAIKAIKNEKISELSQNEKASRVKIIAGYILALLFPVIAILIGVTIQYNRKILPTGEKFYIHTAADRKHGRLIILISITWICLLFIYFFFENRY